MHNSIAKRLCVVEYLVGKLACGGPVVSGGRQENKTKTNHLKWIIEGFDPSLSTFHKK